ncbi:hypothetical protein B0O99DRAFT_356819 [Bisporella sp. PMI_857]|nr:hypothetical protein B0O99DRAFT_356819 [Bisporella sp. PMI_857]
MASGIVWPEGTKFYETSDYKGETQRALNAALIAISTVFIGLRLYVRFMMTKSPGLDDAIAFIAYLSCVTISALDIKAADWGSGAHLELIPENLLLKFFQSIVTQSLFYFWTAGVVRLAIAAFLPRLSKDKTYVILVYIVAGIISVQTIVCFFYKLFQCKPVKDLWLPPFTPGLNCVSTESNELMMNAHAIIGIIIDVALMALPIWVIYKNTIFSWKMLQVFLVFCVGIFAIVTGIVRLYFMKTMDFAVDSPYKMSTIGLWTDLEVHVGLWCGCFPALQPILRQISFKLGWRSKITSYGERSGKKTGATSGNTVVVSGNRFNKHGYIHNGSGIDMETDADSQKAIVSDDKDSYELNPMGKIRKQTELVVEIEAANSAHKGRQESWVNV